MKRWDLTVSSKDKSGKNRYTKVGAIFEKDNGSLSIALDKGVSIVGGMEGVFITGYEPRERDGEQRGSGGGRGRPAQVGGGGYGPVDDGTDFDIPFSPLRGQV